MRGILELLTNQFRGDTVSVVSVALAESPAKVQIAIPGALAALVGGLSNRASTTEGAADLIDLLRRRKILASYWEGRALSTPGGIASLIETGKPLLSFILGVRSAPTTEWLATYSGMKRSSSVSLLSLAAPIALGLIRKEMSAGWNVSNLSPLLPSNAWLEVAPAGLAGVLGTSPLMQGSITRRRANAERSPIPMKIVLSILLLSVLGYSVFRRSPRDIVTSAPEGVVANLSGLALESANGGNFIDATLPEGVTLHIPRDGVENKLLAFIKTPAAGNDQEAWFDFDRLEFEPHSAVFKPLWEERVRNISKILKAYPRVNLRVRARKDDDTNLTSAAKLREDRAKSIVNALVALGIDRTRLSSEGDGAVFPPSNNPTDERRSNAQIAILITRK